MIIYIVAEHNATTSMYIGNISGWESQQLNVYNQTTNENTWAIFVKSVGCF